MITQLIFDSENDDDAQKLCTMLQAESMAEVLITITAELRQIIKYKQSAMHKKTYEAFCSFEQKVFNWFDENNLKTDEL